MKFKMVHENFNVSDLNTSLAFYEKALGLTEHRRKTADDGSFIIVYLKNDESEFELELTWLAEHPQKYDLGEEEFHLAFRVDDIDAAHELHESMGCIAFENKAMGVYFITDPDGYWLEMIPEKKERFEFRDIRQDEAETAAEIEQAVFPENEAVPPEAVKEQVRIAPELFLVAIERSSSEMAGFLNGIATNETRFRDEFFTDKTLHDPDGAVVMLLGLDVLPEYRKQGLARELMNRYSRREQARGRKMLVLTCLPNLVKMYEKMGFTDIGISDSTWGGETWHEMQKILN